MTTSAAPVCVERAPCGTLHVLDSSDVRCGYVLDCASGVQIRLSELAYRVLAAAWSGASFDEIAVANSDAERCLTIRDVGLLYERVVARIDLAEKQQRAHGFRQGFLLRMTLVPASLTRLIAAPFAALFQPVAAVPATVLIACAAAYWATTRHVTSPSPSSGELLAGYALFLVSCLVHELGHAGACLRFGVRPGSIGLALYLVFPVLFSDVTRTWKLRRWHRVAVDAGGSYAQCLCGVSYVALYMRTHESALFFAIDLIIVTTLLNMNPLFRFDGYWIVSDSLGVTGLHTHAWRLLRRLALRCVGRDDPAVPPWPGHIAAAVTIYSIVASIGGAWFAARLIAYALEQGRWLLEVAPAIAAHRKALSLALAGQLGSALLVALIIAYCLIRLLRLVRGATIAR